MSPSIRYARLGQQQWPQITHGTQLGRVHLTAATTHLTSYRCKNNYHFLLHIFFYFQILELVSFHPVTSLGCHYIQIGSASDVMEYKVDLTTARSEDKADQYSSIVIMTDWRGVYYTTHQKNVTWKSMIDIYSRASCYSSVVTKSMGEGVKGKTYFWGQNVKDRRY